MAKYHVRENGEPGVCKARSGKCPLGAGEDQHYGSTAEARTAYEARMESSLLSRFENASTDYSNVEYREELERKKRIDDAVLSVDPSKTVIQANLKDMPRIYDDRARFGYFIHPEFRKALPDNNDMAVYLETVHLDGLVTKEQQRTAQVDYNKTTGLMIYSYEYE